VKYIYLVRAGESTFKVGISANIINRLRELQTSNASIIELITCVPVSDALKVESDLHKYLEHQKADANNEWFVLSPKQALDLAVKINGLGGSELAKHITMRSLLYRQERLENKFNKLEEKTKSRLEQIRPAKRVVEIKSEPQEPIEFGPYVDPLLAEAEEVIKKAERASASFLQRKLRIGYARAARLLDTLEEQGIVSPPTSGAQGRHILPPIEPMHTNSTQALTSKS
jgi:DNA segregation ATPase FtsK/SpoIIIE-like protein